MSRERDARRRSALCGLDARRNNGHATGELLGLRWSDVDLEAATLTVNQIRTVVAYEVVTLTPKTDKGRRTIALDGQTVSALRRIVSPRTGSA